jgi:hypothetical protein
MSRSLARAHHYGKRQSLYMPYDIKIHRVYGTRLGPIDDSYLEFYLGHFAVVIRRARAVVFRSIFIQLEAGLEGRQSFFSRTCRRKFPAVSRVEESSRKF